MSLPKLKTISLKVIKAALILFGLYIIVVSLPWSCGMCVEENIGETYSPDGKYLARAYVRNCGATTGLLTHANLRSRWNWFHTEWPGTIKDGQVFANYCWSRIGFLWKDNSNLEIQYEKCAPREDGRDPAWKKENSWRGINISYREVPRQVENE